MAASNQVKMPPVPPPDLLMTFIDEVEDGINVGNMLFQIMHCIRFCINAQRQPLDNDMFEPFYALRVLS